ncbi:MAG: hypothetical protein ACJ72N_14055 [Labedaea sp.]
MAQVGGGVGGRPGVALPVRVHDLMLGFAGRLDDDALADARELLASAEADRALEFLVGCLVAGRIAVTAAQRAELDDLFAQVHRDPVVADRLVVDDTAANLALRHRFGGGAGTGEPAGQGVGEAARGVLDVLPDVRSVWAVWRLTPAGAVSGPVPHRVVLVGVGPAGFPPATAYRLENALRRNGIRASVEVLRDGTEAPGYHHAAMQYASQVPFSRQAPTNAAPRLGPPAEARVPEIRQEIRQPEPPVQPAPQPQPAQPMMAAASVAQVPDFAPSGRRSRPDPPADPLASANPPARQAVAPQAPPDWLTEPAVPNPAVRNGRQPQPSSGDDPLSEQEKDLLRQLQEELARREQQDESDHLGRGRHGGSQANTFDWPTASGSPTVVNGIPPQFPDRR